MRRTLIALTVATTMSVSSAYALNETDWQKLWTTGKCVKCDLNSANLTAANLSGANLFDANLAYAQMNGATLCNTTMPDGSVNYSGC